MNYSPDNARLSAQNVVPPVIYVASERSDWLNGRVIQCGNGRIGLFSNPVVTREVVTDGLWDLDTAFTEMESAFQEAILRPNPFAKRSSAATNHGPPGAPVGDKPHLLRGGAAQGALELRGEAILAEPSGWAQDGRRRAHQCGHREARADPIGPSTILPSRTACWGELVERTAQRVDSVRRADRPRRRESSWRDALEGRSTRRFERIERRRSVDRMACDARHDAFTTSTPLRRALRGLLDAPTHGGGKIPRSRSAPRSGCNAFLDVCSRSPNRASAPASREMKRR